ALEGLTTRHCASRGRSRYEAQWSQLVANRTQNRPNVETAKVSENRWHGLSPFACDVPWLASTLSVLGRGSISWLRKKRQSPANPKAHWVSRKSPIGFPPRQRARASSDDDRPPI